MQFAIMLTSAASAVFPAVNAHLLLQKRRLQTCATGRHCFSLPCGRCVFPVAATQVANLRYRSALHQSSTPSIRIFRCRDAGCKPALPVDTASVFPAVDAYFPLPRRRLQTCATDQHFFSLPCGRCVFPVAATQVTNLRYRSAGFGLAYSQWATGHRVADRVNVASSRASVSSIGSWP